MTDDLVKRLLDLADCDTRAGEPLGRCMREAADHMKTLQAQTLRLSGMVYDLNKEVAISDALLISEAEASLARLERAEKAEAEKDNAWAALWDILACETPNANATVTRMVAIAKPALKAETHE